jgi:hypothetical protein
MRERGRGEGSTNRRADEALIVAMRRFSRGEVFDEQAMPI